jgi:hypothetical protein
MRMKHLGYLALFIAGAIAGWTVALYWLHPPAASSDSAAWVQAVGSIAAIIASAGIVFLQASMARELSREQRRQQDAVSLSAFQGLAQHALDVVGHALNNLGDQTAARSFFRVFPPETIPSVEAMVDAFPVHQLPSKEHVLHAFQLRGLLRSDTTVRH